MTPEEFSQLRYGMFVHFGLFSALARGEWVMNREGITPSEMEKISETFHPEKFNADEVCDLAVAGGMKYIVFTTMHHEGFRMYDSARTSFNAMHCCGRDFVREIVDSARRHGLGIGLYHSLNNWHDQPDAVAALEDPRAYLPFIANTFARLEELVKKYAPFDILWYDGWWPFNADGWQGKRMNETMRALCPNLLFNGRNGLPGDFGTPEQHLTAPDPWRPWEACVTLNDHWGYHAGDHHWKRPEDIVDMLITCGSQRGNLLLNIGPRGDGSIPEESVNAIRRVGDWLRAGGAEALSACEPFRFSPTLPEPGDRGDWDSQGRFTVSGNNLYLHLQYDPGEFFVMQGLRAKVLEVSVHGEKLDFTEDDGKLSVRLPDRIRAQFIPVLKMICDRPAEICRTGGMRIPRCRHPKYDPVPPDIRYE